MCTMATVIKQFLIAALVCVLVSAARAPLPVHAQYRGEPRTIAHDFLDIEKDLGAARDQNSAVNALIVRAAAEIRPRESHTTEQAIAVLQAIDSILAGEGYTFGKNLLLGRGLETKTVDCDNYCALYIAIAEVIRIPIVPVYAPNHSFVRFYFDDGTYLNWETTRAVVRPDSYYVKTLKIPEESIRAGVYMKTLSRQEFIAVEHNNIGAYLMMGGKYAEAVPYFNTSVRLYPLFSSAYHNRGSSFYALKHPDGALADLLRANELDPSRAGTHNTIGDIYLDRNDLARALGEFNASIKLDPTNYVPYNSIAIIMKLQGHGEQSRIWKEKSQRIKARYGK
ncbi:MAG: hypothetical protein MUC76_14265 [Spirochaetes bacterium]|nr:hypothetical protein [Spirochaetota bacterium]